MEGGVCCCCWQRVEAVKEPFLPCGWRLESGVGMAPAGAGAGLAKTRPQANPRDWKKPAREQTRGCISAPAPAPADFGRVSGARGSNNRYNKNVQIQQFKQSNNPFL